MENDSVKATEFMTVGMKGLKKHFHPVKEHNSDKP